MQKLTIGPELAFLDTPLGAMGGTGGVGLLETNSHCCLRREVPGQMTSHPTLFGP